MPRKHLRQRGYHHGVHGTEYETNERNGLGVRGSRRRIRESEDARGEEELARARRCAHDGVSDERWYEPNDALEAQRRHSVHQSDDLLAESTVEGDEDQASECKTAEESERHESALSTTVPSLDEEGDDVA